MALNSTNYFNKVNSCKYMGSSQFKDFLECEKKALAKIRGVYKQKSTPALLAGSYMDAYFEGNLEKFQELHPELFRKNSKNKKELLKQYSDLTELIEFIKGDSEFMRHCTGKQQQIMTGYISGVPVKIAIDSMLDDLTVDRKVMKSFKDVYVNGEFVPWWKVYRYDIQAYLYQTIRAQNEDLLKKTFILAACTKEKPHDHDLFKFSEETLYNAGQEVLNKINRFDSIKKGIIKPIGCGECDYCRSLKKCKKNNYIII